MPQFEPLKNDLLLRTARGIHLVSTDALLARKLTFQCRRKGRACAHVGDATGQVYTARVFLVLILILRSNQLAAIFPSTTRRKARMTSSNAVGYPRLRLH